MSAPTYTEPQVSFLVLDYLRPAAARLCLESIRRHVKLERYKVIYLHNGQADYPHDLLREGLIDELIMPRVNGGLGLGTRALFAACFSPFAIYWQVDQLMGRDFTQQEVDRLKATLYTSPDGQRTIDSISLAGPVCGAGVYSERAHFVETNHYAQLESWAQLGAGGAGPYHHLPWREGVIQAYYAKHNRVHLTDWPPLAIDNGRDAVRQNPDGSVWRHEPDQKRLWLVSGPVKEPYVYPKLNAREWEQVIATQTWPAGQVPENEVKDSFTVPHWHSNP
jgi:hypothetical protein